MAPRVQVGLADASLHSGPLVRHRRPDVDRSGHTAAKRFYLPSADYIWPHVLNKRVWEVVTSGGSTVVGEQYFALDHLDYDHLVDDIMASGADVVFNTIVPPGLTPFLARLHDAGFTARGGSSCAPTSTRTSSTSYRPSTSTGSTGASTTTAT